MDYVARAKELIDYVKDQPWEADKNPDKMTDWIIAYSLLSIAQSLEKGSGNDSSNGPK